MKRIAAIVASGLLAAAGLANAQDIPRSDSQPDTTTPPPADVTTTPSPPTHHPDMTPTESPNEDVGAPIPRDNSSSVPDDSVTGESAHIPSLDALDTNRDGSVSSTEAASSREIAAVFTQADADKNGRLNREEYAQAVRLIQG